MLILYALIVVTFYLITYTLIIYCILNIEALVGSERFQIMIKYFAIR